MGRVSDPSKLSEASQDFAVLADAFQDRRQDQGRRGYCQRHGDPRAQAAVEALRESTLEEVERYCKRRVRRW